MKKLFLLLALGECLSVSAEESVDGTQEAQKPCDISGFNIGVDLTQTWTVGRNYSDYFYYNDGAANVDNDKSLYKAERSRLTPGINLGYSHKCACGGWLGVSGEMMFAKSKEVEKIDDLVNPGAASSINANFQGTSCALKLKAGYHFDKAVVYAIAGLKWQKVTFQEDDAFKYPAVRAKNGMPVLGVGLEKKICGNLNLTVEYEHFWRKSSVMSVAEDPTCGGAQAGWTEAKTGWQPSVHGNSIRLGLKYYPKF